MFKLFKVSAWLFVVLHLFLSSAIGGDVPILKEVQVNTNVEIDMNSKIYTYKYMVINPPNSPGSIQRIEVDISKPVNSVDLDSVGLINGVGYLKNSSEHILATSAIKMIPVGFSSIAQGWLGSVTIEGMGKWGSKSAYQIKPGQKLEGFTLSSKGLPTIRVLKVTPKIDKEALYPNVDDLEDDSEVAKIITKMKQDEEDAKYRSKTIGPTAPPAVFKPLEFIDSIINMKHEAFNLGWIKNQGILHSLDAKLDNARKKLENGDTKTAKNILNAFINEVEAQGCSTYENCPSGKHLTSEAYGLLKYNAQYLIDHLQ